jgi:hypothetical protein
MDMESPTMQTEEPIDNDLAGFDDGDEAFFAGEEIKTIESNPNERHVEEMKTKRPRESRPSKARKPRESFSIGNQDVNFADIMV